ncbi:RluA family pseudouridine synthase [Helicobacter sp. MIT 05-5294]|uniref:RluA family pseudouridine synthase n=1 Tax=Helicobacter sp. MIT 05-5294 TaxID=1548150 RepID=UPI001EE8B3D9|nr:RluA family pseudouridine synthase [Helicobacter sp. MIT 05-5294]
MPFIVKEFAIPTPTKAYQALMQILHCNMAQSQRYINKGKVIYQGKVLGNSEKSKILQDSVSVVVFQPNSIGLKPLFENADFSIFNKPAKMLIHPKGRFAHHSLIDEIRALYGEEASLTHRIDKETSGLVLVGKHKKSVGELGEHFAQNAITKEYLALVRGSLSQSKFGGRDFCLSLPLATQPKGGDLCVRSVYFGALDSSALKFKEAKSAFEMLGLVEDSKGAHYTLLKVYPKTGRTHQIRVHLSALGFPILGDPLYGAQDCHSREYLDAEFISPQQEESQFSMPTEEDNNQESCNIGLSDAKRLEYFGATRLMLHAYALKFEYHGKTYHFKSGENFEIV